MKKLLHISANQLPDPSQDHHTVRIWEELAKGFDEYHIIGRAKSNRFEYSKKGNIHQHLVPALGKRNRSFFISSFYIFYLVRKHQITHLLSQSSIWGGFTATLAAKLLHIPHMVEIHGDVYFKYLGSDRFFERILSYFSKYSFKNATKVRSLSASMTNLLNQNGIDGNIVEIPNRVNTKLFGPPKIDHRINGPVKIISVGRFVPQKGYDIAIKSIQELGKKYDITLKLIGGGKMTQQLLNMIGKDNRIELIDWIPQNELIELMKSSDIYIQPSLPYLGEAMPRTILEAMALGLPIISSNIAAIPGILIDGYNALLIAPGSESDLSESLEKIILDDKLRSALGKNAYMDASSKYEWESMFELYRRELSNM